MRAIPTVSIPVISVLVFLHFTDIAIKPQYHTFMSVEDVRDSNCIGGTAIVPQKVYTASNTHANFEPEATLEFWQGELRGVSLRDATQDTFLQGDTGITDGNVPITRVLTAEKIMIRLEVRISYKLLDY